MTGQLPGLHQVTVDGPELFTRPEPSDQLQILVKVMVLFAGRPPAVPETILRLQPVLTLGYDDWSEGQRFNLEMNHQQFNMIFVIITHLQLIVH